MTPSLRRRHRRWETGMRVDGIGGVGKRRGEESKRKRSSGSIVGPASRLGRKEAKAVPETSWDCGE